MAQELIKKTRFNVDSDTLLNVLTDPEFVVAKEMATGSLEAHVNQLSDDGTTLKYEVHTQEYARGLTGVDKSKREKNVTTTTWNRVTHSCTWTHTSDNSFADRITVSGTQKIASAGASACELNSTFKVDIRVPLVGKKIEKLVLEEVDRAWAKYDATIEQFIAPKG